VAIRTIYLARHAEAGQDGALTLAGRQQASLLGERLRGAALSAVYVSPVPRAVQTAELLTSQLPGVPSQQLDLVGDYPPPAGHADLPPGYARVVDSYSAQERAEGARLAAAAIERFTQPGPDDSRELIITHNFLIGWFVRDALGAPDWRWLGLNQCNAALSVIRYQSGLPPGLVSFNDMDHLPAPLRWTGFPAQLRG
jgi:probable phosphoglycerate mutase